ncbi:MAG TPA: hypothetical protein VE863_09330 [Pyrinomonadaceae bacterium]|jgi:hypothetical protein|nr:hypothetical protein [Pyrinomonadaceae bacterium]
MVSLFIFGFISLLVILLIAGVGLYFWQKSAPDNSERILPPSPNFYGLFGDQAPSPEAKTQEEIERRARAASSLIERAASGDKSALNEAGQSDDPELYQRVLNEFVNQANSDAALLSLMSYVAQNELPVNGQLAKATIASWQANPDRSGTAKALHVAALSDDADCYREAVEQALQFWRAGKLGGDSASELRALFDGEFWILSARTRSSGAGFVLKRTLDSARRELEAASATQ